MRRNATGLSLVTLSILGLLAAGGAPALADSIAYGAELTGKAEVPPNEPKGSGTLEATYDTAAKTLTYKVTYSGLTGPASSAHFHGPAAAGKNAGVVIPVQGATASPIEGKAQLTDEQESHLKGGLLYFNIHTSAHPIGEIRGQVTAK
jgi:hypothetical protein